MKLGSEDASWVEFRQELGGPLLRETDMCNSLCSSVRVFVYTVMLAAATETLGGFVNEQNYSTRPHAHAECFCQVVHSFPESELLFCSDRYFAQLPPGVLFDDAVANCDAAMQVPGLSARRVPGPQT